MYVFLAFLLIGSFSTNSMAPYLFEGESASAIDGEAFLLHRAIYAMDIPEVCYWLSRDNFADLINAQDSIGQSAIKIAFKEYTQCTDKVWNMLPGALEYQSLILQKNKFHLILIVLSLMKRLIKNDETLKIQKSFMQIMANYSKEPTKSLPLKEAILKCNTFLDSRHKEELLEKSPQSSHVLDLLSGPPLPMLDFPLSQDLN